jgi:phosphatidylserine/phosphatidylglycerophosphate/cardiolipin synthase-like enzyme
MRITKESSSAEKFRVRAFAGTRAILIAIDCPEQRRIGLLGFAFQRGVSGGQTKFLRSKKVFQSVVPDPKNARDPDDPDNPRRYYTDAFPIQSFLWGDYAVEPDTLYRFRVMPMYGKPGALATSPADEIKFEIRTEKEWYDGAVHGVWFNRGAIASQYFAEEFGNAPPENLDDPNDPEVKWLSRGLLEACLEYIDETPAGDGLRVAAYEFTYKPILDALKRAQERGVDLKIVYHDTADEKGRPNESAMEAAGFKPNDGRVAFKRSQSKIPHNKFIVRLKGGNEPVEVWTGSTNFTSSGFLGQTNVGHRVADAATAERYFEYWKALAKDPDIDSARMTAQQLTPDPPEAIDPNGISWLFSPRVKSLMLGYYGRRMLDAANSVWFTAAFGVTEKLVAPLAEKREQMRFVLMEKPASDKVKKALTQDFNRVILSYGIPLGEIYRMKDGKPTSRASIEGFELDKWFFAEEHYRANNDGFVFFVHAKFLLIDPLSDDPLVISGSPNFSPGSLLENDENQLLIRGDTRVADIYLTEYDRVFRHFYFRDIANELANAEKSDDAKAIFLSEDDSWSAPYFKKGCLKNNRRLMFFADPSLSWALKATAEEEMPKAPPKKKSAASKEKSAKPTKKAKPATGVKAKSAKSKAMKAKASKKKGDVAKPVKTKTAKSEKPKKSAKKPTTKR